MRSYIGCGGLGDIGSFHISNGCWADSLFTNSSFGKSSG